MSPVLSWLARGFETGQIIQALIGLLVFEAILIMTLCRQLGWRRAVTEALLITVPGVFLMLAVFFALTNADWRFIGASLGAAGLVHALDLIRRLRT